MPIDRSTDGKVIQHPSQHDRRIFELHRLDRLPERPQREEIVEGFFAAGELVATVAPAGQGKSAVVQLLATCVAEGRSFLGRKVLAGPVIYLAAERWAGASRRLLALQRKPKAPLYIASARPDLSNRADVETLAIGIQEICERERSCPALIVIDTLARCMPGLDENSARDTGLVVEGLTRLGELVPSAAIVFIHHTGKNGTEMRGSTALIGAVDLELRVESKGHRKHLVVSKANAVVEGQVLPFKLEPIEYREHPNADAEMLIAAREADETVEFISSVSNADARSQQVFRLIQESATSGSADRAECLQAVRREKVIEGKTPASTAETFRKILIELRSSGFLTFDNKTISLQADLNPNRPNLPP